MREDIILKALQHTGEAPDEERFRQEITGVLTRLPVKERQGLGRLSLCRIAAFDLHVFPSHAFFARPLGGHTLVGA